VVARPAQAAAEEDKMKTDSAQYIPSRFTPDTNARNLRQQEEAARQSILNQILEPEAADRLGRIRLVKESRAADVENRLIMLARSGQLRQKITEDQLKELLGSVAESKKDEEKIVVSRRKGGWDDEDDDLLDL
jgi:DNA-binding TFAR19-related protein (PDSD5 family)